MYGVRPAAGRMTKICHASSCSWYTEDNVSDLLEQLLYVSTTLQERKVASSLEWWIIYKTAARGKDHNMLSYRRWQGDLGSIRPWCTLPKIPRVKKTHTRSWATAVDFIFIWMQCNSLGMYTFFYEIFNLVNKWYMNSQTDVEYAYFIILYMWFKGGYSSVPYKWMGSMFQIGTIRKQKSY